MRSPGRQRILKRKDANPEPYTLCWIRRPLALPHLTIDLPEKSRGTILKALVYLGQIAHRKPRVDGRPLQQRVPVGMSNVVLDGTQKPQERREPMEPSH